MNVHPQHRATLAALFAGGLIGLIVALQSLDPQFIAGTGGKWLRPENDYNIHLVGWHYFVRDAWRLPLFSVPMMGYPEGGSVLLNDALPLAALASKLAYRLSGVIVNPFGWWILLTYVLQGVMAVRVLQAVGVQSIFVSAAAAALAVCSTSFMTRMDLGHTALSTHGLLLWAIALHFSSLRQSGARHAEWTVLLVTTLLVNAYLFVMVLALAAATLVARGVRRRLDVRDLGRAALGIGLVAVLGLLAGYGPVLTNPATMKSEGFGHFSWNLASLFLPPEGFFGVLGGVTRDATQGQYEGDAYLGRGALLLLALAATSPRRVAGYLRRYWVLAATLVALAGCAASNRVYLGGLLIASYELPQLALDVASAFRASGRFIWPLAYGLTLLPLACLHRWWPRPVAALVAALAVFLQVSEVVPDIRYRRVQTTLGHDDLIDEARMGAWLAEHRRLWQYPSWDCGGLVGHERRWGSRNFNRELQLQLAAAKAGRPTNSVHMSRVLKDCSAEATWLDDATLEDGVLYVLARPATEASPVLSALQRSTACVTLDWAVVCSARWRR